jgi:nitrous oxidase accessory protein NosD
VSNGNVGIVLSTNSNDNVISNNQLQSNLQGMQIFYLSNRNVIHNNDIQSNVYYGIWIGSNSNYNLIHHNNFIDNNAGGKQGYDDSGGNYWNDTTQGNYWSDYHLLTQGCSDVDSNGICDAPYVLAGGAGAFDWKAITTPMVPEFPSVNLVWLAAVLIAAIVVALRGRKK